MSSLKIIDWVDFKNSDPYTTAQVYLNHEICVEFCRFDENDPDFWTVGIFFDDPVANVMGELLEVEGGFRKGEYGCNTPYEAAEHMLYTGKIDKCVADGLLQNIVPEYNTREDITSDIPWVEEFVNLDELYESADYGIFARYQIREIMDDNFITDMYDVICGMKHTNDSRLTEENMMEILWQVYKLGFENAKKGE